MKSAFITGGAGFFGGILKRRLLEQGISCVSIDLEPDVDIHPLLTSIQGDIRDISLLEKTCSNKQFDAVFHCAAILAHVAKDNQFLWTSNVDGTRNVADLAKKHDISKFVFISSNCLWGQGFDRSVTEDDKPDPIEIYGKSKWEGEKILHEYQDVLDITIIRCPTIVDEGRLGLLSILFEFMDEGRKVWVVGGGKNKYQFIYAPDLVNACLKTVQVPGSRTVNIGSDNVRSFHDVYQYVIDRAGTNARVAALPAWLILPLMRIAHILKLSPLGPYQYKMIAEDFCFDTRKIKKELSWQPTLTNEEMLWKAYHYYHEQRDEIKKRSNVSAHKQAAKMGVIRLLKWIS